MAVLQGVAERLLILGTKVDKAATTLPTSGNSPVTYFTVAGGRVLLTALVGEVTTIIQAQASNLKWVSTPSAGTAVDLCAVLAISGKELGCLLGITGLPADAMVGTNAGLTTGMKQQLILPSGSLGLHASVTNTGATKWSLFYIPIDDGASVVAA